MTGTGDADRDDRGRRDDGATPEPAPTGWGDATWPGSDAIGYGPSPTAPQYGQGQPGAPQYGAPQYGAPQYGAPQYGAAPQARPAGQPRDEQPRFRQPADGSPQDPAQHDGQGPQHGTPQYPAPQYPAPQYPPQQDGAPQYGTPQYGAPQYGAPQYGAQQYPPQQYPPQGYGAAQYGQQYGQPRYGTPDAGAFRPPPVQPGIIPLRPLSMTEIYDGAFRAIRANPRVMFGFSAVVVLAMSVLGALTQWALLPAFLRAAAGTTADLDPTGQLGVTEAFAGSLATVGLLPWLLVAGAVLTGLLTGSVSRSVIGQKVTVAELWHRHWRRTLLLLVLAILQMVALVVLAVGVVGVVAVLAAADQPGLAVAALLVLGPAAIALGVWIGFRLLLLPPALVLEGNGVWATVKRAWRLTRGSFWRILGIYLLASVVVAIVGQVLAVPVSVVAMIANPDPTSPVFLFSTTLLSGLVQAISTVFLAAVVALLYIDLRIRREGLDVDLARAAEAAARADADDASPPGRP
ncbi:MAG: glycerophosphoryl diester phosphodiesterase membrane domain-containing protein [Actinotalea sp.]|nr:glycerophosphoryl diester phosphodiesterase membrane domain-containing protein [Actinotalea sp.]